MIRIVYSLIAFTFLTLPVNAADYARPEGGLRSRDMKSPVGQGGTNQPAKAGAVVSPDSTKPTAPFTEAVPSKSTAPSYITAPSITSTPGPTADQTSAASSDVQLRGPSFPENLPAQPLGSPAYPEAPVGDMSHVPGQNPIDFGRSAASPQVPLNDSLSKAATTNGSNRLKQLSANYLTVSATAKMLRVPPLMRCRDDNVQFVEITLRNDSSEVALVHGDIAEAKVGGSMRTAASARYIGLISSPKLNLKGRIYTGLVTAGSWGFAGPIFYENLTPEQHRNRYRGTAIGVDGSRHEIEEQRFGLRVLMPGEETVGWLAFECPDEASLTSLLIPVNYSRSQLPSGSLMVRVRRADESDKPNPVPPVKTQLPATVSKPASGTQAGRITPVLPAAAPVDLAPAQSTPQLR